MGDDLTYEEKVRELWRDYEKRSAANGGGGLKVPDRVVHWILMGAVALSVGPENVKKLLEIFGP